MKRKAYPLNFTNMFGLSVMRWTVIAGSSLMTTAFMMYLTDYSGLLNAAAVATVLLTVGRVLDAVDDPLQGWIMDRSKITRIGKFKPYLLGGIVLTALALLMLFNMPKSAPEWAKILFLFAGYILFEVGVSFQPDLAIKSTMTDDPGVREKLLVTPRAAEQIVAVPFSFFITVALAFGASYGDNRRGFAAASALYVLPIAAVALLGAFLVREGPHRSPSEESLSLRDILAMAKTNKPFWISQVSGFFNGLVFTFVVAAVSYYIKWAYGPAVFGMYSALFGAVILLGILLGTFFAPLFLKKLAPDKACILCDLLQAAPLAVIYVLQFFTVPPVLLFFLLLFAMMFFSGMAYIPGSLLSLECMDYNRYRQGKGLEAMVQAIANFINKAQTAIAGLATGAVLIAIRYDAALYESEEFIAAGGTLPEGLLGGLALVFCLIPVLLSLAAALILRAYPITKAVREEMRQALRAQKAPGEEQ